MKLLLENWREYLKEEASKIYYWQTRGPWKSESQIEFGVTHVPKATPRQQDRIEEIFEEVRKEKFPDRPSRLNCAYLCENLEGYEEKAFVVILRAMMAKPMKWNFVEIIIYLRRIQNIGQRL